MAAKKSGVALDEQAAEADFPPWIPEDKAGLQRAIILLGSRQTQDLKLKARAELAKLIGEYPDSATATIWKRQLRVLQQETD